MNKTKYPLNGDIIVEEAKKYIGSPYKWGKSGPDLFDCAGFTQYIYNKSLGIHIPRYICDQLKFGEVISISDLAPGDLVFTSKAEHVGIYVGKGQFIHAPYEGQKVKISYILDFYTARRIL